MVVVFSLRDISLYKLLHMLHDSPFHKKRVGDIKQLVLFVFESDLWVSESSSMDARLCVSAYKAIVP